MLQRILFRKSETEDLSIKEILFISCFFSCTLLVGRAVYTGQTACAFLLWNLFLAFVPFAVSQWLTRNPAIIKSGWKTVLVLLTWLLFIPNSFYILTDLFHLGTFSSAPKWFDLLLIFSFAWNGLLLGILSVRDIEKIVEANWGRGFSLLLLFAVMWLNAFGVYIGRYLRFNTWDVLVQPLSLFSDMLHILFHPLQNRTEWGMISCYGLFMLLIYITLKKLGEGFYSKSH